MNAITTLEDACKADAVTDRSPTIAEEWITALSESLAVFGALVLERRVVEAWSAASVLPGYTMGGIAGHVLSLMMGLQRRIEAQEAEVHTIPYSDWYGTALASSESHAGLIQMGEELAARGPARLGADLRAVGETLAPSLSGARADRVIPLASVPGAGVRLDDFLRTRFVEIIVHADDVAVSVGIDCPTFPALAWTIAAGVVSETTTDVGGGAEFVLAASRPGRVPLSDHASAVDKGDQI